MQRRKRFTGMLAVLSAVIMTSVPVLASEIPEGYYMARGGNDIYEFRNDGTVVYNGTDGLYRISEDELTVFAGGHAYKYTYEIFNGMLILYGSDGIGDIFDATELSDAIENIPDANIGDTVNFGTYEQDNDLTNGPEAIEWEVLDIQDGKALLLSKYALDCQPYNEEFEEVTWETCTLRAWLNEDFINTAFSPSEAAVIAETMVINADNEKYGTDGGNDTMDKIYLLSIEEAEQYFKTDEERTAELIDGTSVWWWQRSPGYDSYSAANVGSDGSVNLSGGDVDIDDGAVRPALWVNLKF